jgi:hypothetical protein
MGSGCLASANMGAQNSFSQLESNDSITGLAGSYRHGVRAVVILAPVFLPALILDQLYGEMIQLRSILIKKVVIRSISVTAHAKFNNFYTEVILHCPVPPNIILLAQ